MKKNFTLSLLFAAALCATTACSDDENNGDNGGNGNGPGGGNVPVATMQQAQQEIDRVSKVFISKIDAEQLKPVVNLAAYCENTFFGNDGNVDVPNDVFVPDYGINGLVRISRCGNRQLCRNGLTQTYPTYLQNFHDIRKMGMERDRPPMGSDRRTGKSGRADLHLPTRRTDLCG